MRLSRRKGELVNCSGLLVYSGSRGEGLRFSSSDEDWMIINKIVKVMASNSHATIYDCSMTLLLMENEMTKPGFSLLRLCGEFINPLVLTCTQYIINGYYLSSKKWREFHTAHGNKTEFTHGPCTSGVVGSYEYDLAFCLKCNDWPILAHDCIKRLHSCSWPLPDTIQTIVSDGVLFVPIGAKQSFFENTEWRMSFSLAEQKLIHAMNHTQFLCYALLKIFLKEAIDVNPEVKGLLCSYFMKTALFWEITTFENNWNPSMLLVCFWNCFRRILQWVKCSYCPNFFIPPNNMFEGKIEGRNRDKLLQHMSSIYSEGYMCFGRCLSLSVYMNYVFRIPYSWLKESTMSKSRIALGVIFECYRCSSFEIDGSNLDVLCHVLYQFACSTNDGHDRFLFLYWFRRSLTKLCVTESTERFAEGQSNKMKHRKFIERMRVLENCQTDCTSNILHMAVQCYNNGKVNQTLRLVQNAVENVLAPDSMYYQSATEAQYRAAGGERLSMDTVLRKSFVDFFKVYETQQIPHLYVEKHDLGVKFKDTRMVIPSLVFAYFLRYLCKRKLGCICGANETLCQLSLLVQHKIEQKYML